MNINERYWKWKRAFNKRKALISRVISIVLMLCLVAVVVIAAWGIRQSDLRRAELANQEVDKSTIKANKKYDYGESGSLQVAENSKLILSADFTTGEICVTEKASGMNWYSNPQDRADDKLATIKSRLNSQMHIKFVNMDKGVNVEMDNYTASISKGRMEHTLIDNGVKFTFGFTTANLYIPVQYTLTEDGFQAEIVVNEIKGVGSNPYMIDTISLLPYFGAGGLEDEGYLFVPDGPGALIDFNTDKKTIQTYNAPVYGRNITIEAKKQESVRESAMLPVFGSKVNDHAFFAVITSGDANSTISAAVSKKDSSYNHVYANAVLSEYYLKQMNANHMAGVGSHSIDYRTDLTDGKNYCVRYFFLEGENANYTGMSNLYRDYLKKNGQLKDSELVGRKYMVLDLIGAVSIEKYVVGVKMPVVTALTTYNDVCEIVKELKAQGVENIIVNYIGALEGGLNNTLFDKVDTESVLGTKKEFKQMVSFLQEQGVLLFLETNPIDIYNSGNGYQENRDSVKSFFNDYAFQYKYDLDTAAQNTASRWHLLRPVLVAELVEEFAQTFEKWDIDNLSIDRLGSVLYSDYNEDKQYHITRTGTKALWEQTLKSADEATKYLMLHGGNAYTAAYADVLTDIPDSHSSYDALDRIVPFYQLTFQNNTLLTAGGINTTVDYEYAFLKALETGCSLKYNMIYGKVEQLVGTDYNTMVSYSYDYWKGLAAEQYKEMQEAVGHLAGKEIVSHEFLAEDVTLTRYENAEVVINYGLQSFTYQGNEIAAGDYVILSGGAK